MHGAGWSSPQPPAPVHTVRFFGKSGDLDQSSSFVIGARLGPSFPSPRYSASPWASPVLVQSRALILLNVSLGHVDKIRRSRCV